MSEKVKVRPYRKEDLVAVAEVDREVFGDQCYPGYFFRQAFDVFGDLLLVAQEQRGEIIGYILGALQTDSARGWILSLAVMPAYRRQGVAGLFEPGECQCKV